MKSTLTAIALLFAIPGMAVAQDNSNLSETAKESPIVNSTDANANATGEAMEGAAVACDDENAADQSDLPETDANTDLVDCDPEAETETDSTAGAAMTDSESTVGSDDPASATNGSDANLPETAGESPAN